MIALRKTQRPTDCSIYIPPQEHFRSAKLCNGTKLKLRFQLVFTKNRRVSRPFSRNIYTAVCQTLSFARPKEKERKSSTDNGVLQLKT